ncbi:MAG: hypothetical protein ABI587_02490 [Gemmatimonadales bacterium]
MTTPATPVRGRIMTHFAVGILVLDGVLLLLIGLWSGALWAGIAGAACVLLAGSVLLLWRRHRRALAELAEARHGVREEARALRDLLRRE